MAQSPASRMPLRGAVTYAEFLSRDDGEPREWVHGEVVPMAPVSLEHQYTSSFLLRLLSSFIEQRGLGQVLYEPFNMKTGPELPGRSPDIMFVATAHLDRLRPNYLEGPADIVVEVVSPGSAGRDRGDKYYEYEAGGVGEYWLVDPAREVAEFYILDDSGRYATASVADGVFHSRELPGFWLKVDWLWQRPPLRDVEAQLGLR